jgi:hypothetical protein
MSIRAIKWAIEVGQTVDISPVQMCVLFVLSYHHNDRDDACFPAMATIGNECGVSERAARNAVRALEHVGLVKTKKRSNKSGQASNQYILFGTKKNKSGRNLRSGTGRNDNTGTKNWTGRNACSDDKEYINKGDYFVPRVVNGGRYE